MFNLTVQELEKGKAVHTANEIYQQPEVWNELFLMISKQEKAIKNFISAIFERHQHTRIVLTGAGTSAFVGDTLLPELRKQMEPNVQIESIPTTNIVSNPDEYLFKSIPTIMVSFARSGNSPESIAAISLGEKLVDNFYQVVITCNKDGRLARRVQNNTNAITILTPDKAHDQGFAMTSSFTCMIIAAYTMLAPYGLEELREHRLTAHAKVFRNLIGDTVDDILTFNFERIIYLGSGLLGQLSHESALKMLELSAGKVVAVHESSLGFRHGPKSIVNDKSIVVLFMSHNPYTRKYDLDILRELAADHSEMKVVVLTEKSNQEIDNLANWVIQVNFGQEKLTSDFNLALLYIIFAQVLALKKSLQLGITPDNPSPDGRVNRVVKGVNIYEFV